MKSKYTVKLKTIVEELNLKALHKSKDYETAVLRTSDVNAPPCSSPDFIIILIRTVCRLSAASKTRISIPFRAISANGP